MFLLDIDPASVPNIADTLKVVTATVMEQLQEDPNTFLVHLGEQALKFGMKVLAALAIYIVGAWLIKRLRALLKTIFTKRNTEATLASFIMSLVTISSYVLLVIIAVGTLGVNTTSLAALLAAGGMAIGMALSGTVQNFAGGIMLLAFKPFKAGDFIEAQGYSGTVEAVTIVSTRIRTSDNRIVIIPNGSLSNGTINNFSGKPVRRVEWQVSVEYNVDSDKCMELLSTIVKQDPRALSSEYPGASDVFVALSSLNDKDITFVVRAWTLSEDYWGLYFDVNNRIYKELPPAGFGFAYPYMDVRLVKDNGQDA